MKKPKLELKIDKEKYLAKLNKHRKGIISLTVVTFILAMMAGSYYVLFMIDDNEAMTAGQKRLEELEITFDKKTIEELSQEQEPAVIQGPAGQNPFSPL